MSKLRNNIKLKKKKNATEVRCLYPRKASSPAGLFSSMNAVAGYNEAPGIFKIASLYAACVI